MISIFHFLGIKSILGRVVLWETKMLMIMIEQILNVDCYGIIYKNYLDKFSICTVIKSLIENRFKICYFY